MKPRLNPAEFQAYLRASELKYGQKVTLKGVKAVAVGQLPGRLVFRIKNRNTEIYPGDPRLLEMELA